MSQISRTIVLLVTMHLLSNVTGQEQEKRGPQGFLGMRGKKIIDGSTEQFYKRRPQFFVGVKGKKNLYDILEASEYYKRAPMGFMGMRGKKDLYLDEFKRGPMGFVGMRGKKDLSDEYYPEIYGPKQGSLIGQIDYSANENNEYPLLNQFLSEYLNKMERPNSVEAATESSEPSEDERFTNEVEKRAASIHQFFGVRGKKSLQNKRPYDVTFRGKFIGVRGKKDLKNSGAQEIKFLLDNGPLPKRKGAMGFIGMRGKKWMDGGADESSPESDNTN